ncbi:MAG TPA: hypothetical protein VNP89_04440 [Gaiellaceae bacterium]|nr:hypothetical protein [Gaiellaceae bacterium]
MAPHLGLLIDENQRLVDIKRKFVHELDLNPGIFWPFFRPCDVRVLVVADGLDFSEDGFGLTTFVRTLLDMPGGYARFRITLGHIGAAAATQMMDGEPRIVRRITQLKFDDTDHFAAGMYDEVWLFGIAQSFFGRGTAADGTAYPTTRLADTELRALTEFVNAGGGLFATGDHGALGRFLCAEVPRVRNMRLWQSTSAQLADDEVSMTGERRNDTNRIGSSGGSQFNDQSDDTPQVVLPRRYERTRGFFRFSFPHPLLCGPKGTIAVMPDHPHEGECIEPPDTGLSLNFGGPLGAEYPNAVGGGPKPTPEVISTSTVLSGTTSDFKDPTEPHSFGGICAYDGHRAGIGRVVTDATWHHFVNVNLVGDRGVSGLDPKYWGFLYSVSGQAHLEEVRAYYRNIAVWLARPERIACMNTRMIWRLLWTDRVMEAVLSTTDLRVADVEPRIFVIIGKHARDVLGRFAGQCQSIRLILDLVFYPAFPQLVRELDPWLPDVPRNRRAFDGVPWFDAAPLLDIGFGAALVGLREEFPQPDERVVADISTAVVTDVASRAGRVGVERALRSAKSNMDAAAKILDVKPPRRTAKRRPPKKS